MKVVLRWVARWLTVIGALIGLCTSNVAIAAPGVAHGEGYSYDTFTAASIEHTSVEIVGARSTLLHDVGDASTSRPVSARGTSTTPYAADNATEAVDIGSANFAQKTAGANFSAEGAFAGAPRSQIVGQLQSGALTAADVPVEVIVRNGQTLILNTRSATALTEAGIPRWAWSVVNMTGDAAAEARLTAQLARNGLTEAGIPTVRAK